MDKRLHQEWIRHCRTPEEKQKVYDVILGSNLALSQLKALVQEIKAGFTRQEETIDDFDDPSWACKQAFRNGVRAGLRRVEDLLGHL